MSNNRSKRKDLPRSTSEMSKEMLQETLKKKRECNSRAVQIVERLSEGFVDEEGFLSQLEFINKTHLEDVIVERAISKLCGYPLCLKQLDNVPVKKYHISTRHNKVYDITERKNFCSNVCYKAAMFIKSQLLTSPLWFRDQEVIPKFVLLKSSSSSMGEEVVFKNDEVKVGGNGGGDGNDDNDASLVQNRVTKFDNPNGTCNETIDKWIQKVKDIEQITVQSVAENLLAETLMSQSTDAEPQSDELVPKPTEPNEFKENKKSNASNISNNTNVRSKTTFHKNRCLKDNSFQKTQGQMKITSKILMDSITRVEKCILEWFSLHTMLFIYGEEELKELLSHRTDEIEELIKRQIFSSGQSEKMDRMIRFFSFMDIGAFNGDLAKDLKPLPNYSVIKEDCKNMQIKVKAFYSGQLELEKSMKESDKSAEEDSNNFMPLVDAHAQNALRRRIVMDRLNRVVPELLRTLNADRIIEMSEVRELVTNFTLSAENITFKPVEWDLVAVIIIKMLSLKNKRLGSVLALEIPKKHLTLFLMSYQLQQDYLDNIIEWLTSSQLGRRPIGNRMRDSSEAFAKSNRCKKFDKESASREFNETIETIKRFADHGNLPQIYDPLKSCFEVLKPFHLSDLDMGRDLEKFQEQMCRKNEKGRKDEARSGDDERKSQNVFIPRLNLKPKQESDRTDSDVETQVTTVEKSSSSRSDNREKNSKNESKHCENAKVEHENVGDTSFEHRFFSSDEKSQTSEEESGSEASRKNSSGDQNGGLNQTLVSPKKIPSRPEQGDSPKHQPSSRRSKKSVYSTSSSEGFYEDEHNQAGQVSLLTDSQITQELRMADQRAIKTVAMIEQIREAIASYQQKDHMTDAENRELKRNQRKLSKNLQQLEKITARVKHLVGLADKSFKKKWDELESAGSSSLQDDLQAGGDAQQAPNLLIDMKIEEDTAKELTRANETLTEEIAPGPESDALVQNEAAENEEEKAAEKSAEAEVESPRTKLKKDLKKIEDEIIEDFEDSEMETADEVESQEKNDDSADERFRNEMTEEKIDEPPEMTDSKAMLVEEFSGSTVVPELIERKMSKLLVCENKTPSIPALEGLAAFKTASLPSVESDAKSVPEVMLSLTGRLSESYSMQEKLAAENADLEGLRYQLQEELITKENAVELLQRKVANLQAEMRLIVRENTQLNDKLIGQGMNPGYEDKVSVKVTPPTQDDMVDMKLDEYRETTHTLEATVGTLEAELKRLQHELSTVQKERQELENHRKMMKINVNVQRRGMGTHGGLLNPLPPRDSNTELQVKEMKEQYDRLQQDFNNKMMEVASLRAQNDKLMEITDKAREERDFLEKENKSLEKRLQQLEGEKTKMLGSKEQLFEQEQQMNVIKLRFREAQDEIDELRSQVDDQTSQLEDYRNKYLQAQQQVEEQIRQIDHMEIESQRAREEQNAEIQRIKQCFQDKLLELTPLPDILKDTQMKLQEAQQLRMIAERNFEDLQKELQDSKDRSNTLLRRIESERSTQQLGLDERSQLTARLENWEKKCNELREENAQLKTTVARLDEASAQNEKRLDEKLHEVAQFSNQLETLREESARQVTRCKDRNETIKRSLQNQIADLERQLAQARASAKTAQKDKDEIRQRMQTQINNLNENFEQAQQRIKSLQSHVNFLKNSYSGMFTPEPSSMSLVDSTSAFLMEPPCNPCDCSY